MFVHFQILIPGFLFLQENIWGNKKGLKTASSTDSSNQNPPVIALVWFLPTAHLSANTHQLLPETWRSVAQTGSGRHLTFPCFIHIRWVFGSMQTSLQMWEFAGNQNNCKQACMHTVPWWTDRRLHFHNPAVETDYSRCLLCTAHVLQDCNCTIKQDYSRTFSF